LDLLEWEHPKDESGHFIPLSSRDTARFAELTQDGWSPEEILTEFMPDFSTVPKKQMGLAVYETTTEGTPLSPVFPTPKLAASP
jgi:hypothetical protein